MRISIKKIKQIICFIVFVCFSFSFISCKNDINQSSKTADNKIKSEKITNQNNNNLVTAAQEEEKRITTADNQNLIQSKRNESVKSSAVDKITIGTFNLMFFGDDNKNNNHDFGEFGVENIRQPNSALLSEVSNLIKDIDILALQEIENAAALDLLINYLNKKYPQRNYRGFIDDKNSSCQDIAIIWDTNKIYGWKGFKFDRTFNSLSGKNKNIKFARTPIYNYFEISGKKIIFATTHLKAKSTEDKKKRKKDDERRLLEAQRLLDWLEFQKDMEKNEYIILAGDLNEEYADNPNETTLRPLVLVDKLNSFIFLTKKFDKRKEYTNFSEKFKEVIDHIIISEKMQKYYVKNSCRIIRHNNPDFLVSDHYPVLADFDFSKK